MQLLEKVRTSLRRTASSLDEEIVDIINSAISDLRYSGIPIPPEADFTTAFPPLVERAVILYSKAHFGYGDKPEKYLELYDSLKAFLALSGQLRDDFDAEAGESDAEE